jgi:capsular polysaccharide transport system permease protein
VAIERQQLAGSDRGLAKKIAEYESLMLEKVFAEKLLTAAANSVESARLDAQRQQAYIERIVSPALPDGPSAPKRGLVVLVIAAVCLLVFLAMRSLFSYRHQTH